MELMLITPKRHLEIQQFLPGRFCLAHIAARDEEYKNHFKQASIHHHGNHRVMLDNGCFEEDLVSDEVLVSLTREIKPEWLIIPDLLNEDVDRNYARAMQFIQVWIGEIPETTKLMFVPQVEPKKRALNDLNRIVQTASSNAHIQGLGLCRDALGNACRPFTHTKDQELNRFWYLTHAFSPSDPPKIYLHCLGVGDRVDLIQHYWMVDSMDTASFFHQGMFGQRITNGTLIPICKRPKYYFDMDFQSAYDWQSGISNVLHNCLVATRYARKATELRKTLLGEKERI